MSQTGDDRVTVTGGCHCGAVRFEVDLPEPVVAHRCNCSICTAGGFIGIITPASRFRLLTDWSALSEYRFNSGVARHWFCSHCGIKSFYLPRSNPDGFNINLNCLRLPAGSQVEVRDFDGRHWEQNAAQLHGLSRE